MNDWFEDSTLTAKTGDNIRAIIWQVSKELRPGLIVTLRRIKNYTATVSHKEDGEEVIDKQGKDLGHKTELECCGKTLTIAPLKLESGAEWLLDQWIKQLDRILQKYESNPATITVSSINSPETLIQAATQTQKYKDIYEKSKS